MGQAAALTLATDSREGASELARGQFTSLEQWLYSQEAGCMDLTSVELGEELRGRELLRLLLQAHVDMRGDGYVGPSIEVFENGSCENCVVYSHKRIQERKVVTLFGEIRVRGGLRHTRWDEHTPS